MRLLIVGPLEGHIAAAGKIALDNGAKVAHVDGIGDALAALRAGQGADLVMVDVKLDIASLCQALGSERFSVPVVACGIGADPKMAGNAIRAGAKEYVPLPPDAELIAAVLVAVAEESNAVISRDPRMRWTLGVLTLLFAMRWPRQQVRKVLRALTPRSILPPTRWRPCAGGGAA